MQAIVCRYKYRHMKTRRFLYRFKAAVIAWRNIHTWYPKIKKNWWCMSAIFHILFHVLFSQLKYPFSPLFIQSYWPVQTKIRQYVHWSNIVAVRLLTHATAKLNQCVVFVFRLILVVTLYNGFTRYSIWIDNHCLAASLQPVSILPYCLKPRMKRLRLINLAAILNWQTPNESGCQHPWK